MICGCALTKNGDCQDCDMCKESEDEEVEEVERLPVFWYRIIVAMLARMRE
jgi:hypothetical protein